MNNARTGVPRAIVRWHDARAVGSSRRLVVLLASVLALFAGAEHVRAQSQGVGVTIERPGGSAQASSPPSTSPAASHIPSSPVPSGVTVDPTTTSVTSPGDVSGGTTSNRPLPSTGVDVLRLVTLGLGLITVGQVVLRAVRAAQA